MSDFDFYTDSARRGVFLALQEAIAGGSLFIEVPHLVLGIMAEHARSGNPALLNRADVKNMLQEIRDVVPPPGQTASEDVALSHGVKEVLARAAAESRALAHQHIAPEHFLLGMLTDLESRAAKVLLKYRVDRKCILESFTSRGTAAPRTDTPVLRMRRRHPRTFQTGCVGLDQLLYGGISLNPEGGTVVCCTGSYPLAALVLGLQLWAV